MSVGTEHKNECKLSQHLPAFKARPDPNYMEEELYVKGHTVIWSQGIVNNYDDLDNGRKTICCYTLPAPIQQAVWCTFYCEKPVLDGSMMHLSGDAAIGTPMEAICICDSHNIKVFNPKGEDFAVALPFNIRKLWSTKYGIFIEKGHESFPKESLYKAPATLYSLSFPLDDICPVAMNQSGNMFVLNNNDITLVYTNENPSICMVYDTTSRQHSVYRIRKLKPEECDFKDRMTENLSVSHSHKLKSRLSIWDNVVNSQNAIPPSPCNAKPSTLSIHVPATRPQSSMAVMSRCQSLTPTSMDSPWIDRQPKINVSVKTPAADKSFFDYSKTVSYLRTNPTICLDFLWIDNYSVQDSNVAGPASRVFLVDDFMGQKYLCYIVDSRCQLSMVKIDVSCSNISFGMLTSIGAKDAVPIPNLHMFAILEHNGNVSLYSGLTVVGKLYIAGTLVQHMPSPYIMRNVQQFSSSPYPRRSSLLPHLKTPDLKFEEHLLSPVLPTGSAPLTKHVKLHMPAENDNQKTYIAGLMDAVDNRITLKYSDGTYYRVTLPILASSSLIENCILALRQILQKDSAMTFLARWYALRNNIGMQNITKYQEWEMFCGLLYELLGYDDEQSTESSQKDIPMTPSSCPKKQKYSTGTDKDWEYLLNSETSVCNGALDQDLKIKLNKPESKRESNEFGMNPRGALFPYIRLIHFSLHLLYEEMKLNTLHSEDLSMLIKFLNRLAVDLGLNEYNLMYWSDFPDEVLCVLCEPRIPSNELKNIHFWPSIPDTPVNIMKYVYELFKGKKLAPYPYLPNVNVRSRNIVQLCGLLTMDKGHSELLSNSFVKDVIGGSGDGSGVPTTPLCHSHRGDSSNVELAIMFMVDTKIDTSYLETLPVGIYFVIYNALWSCRENPPSDWPAEAYHLLCREDLAAQAMKIEKEKHESPHELLGMYSNTQLEDVMPGIRADSMKMDGMEDIENSLTKLRFSEDVRVSEARKMLQSSKPVPIVLQQSPDISDHDFIEEQEKHLYGICIRTMALPVGRGMFTLRTATPVITEPLPAPLLCLTGKAPPRGTTIELNHIDTPTNMNLWPLFHNGVANGLRVTPDAHNIDNSWIILNKSMWGNEPQVEHAGFLLALGLNGHLKNLVYNSTFSYLEKAHEMTSVGILLGLSAAFRGTCNPSLTKTLAIHVEALLPPTSMELDIAQTIQVAGMLGIGLVYQGSAHRHITEVLLSEIGRPPGPEMENSLDRESYSLAAGLALGLVVLKHGGQPAGLSDLNVPDTLHYYMVGGNKRALTGSQKDKYKTSSFQIREGSSVNLDVTAPGATLALGLMYLGTGNKAVADWMSPPVTQYLLDFVRPDFLLLRVLSRSLILWDDIQPTKAWVESQVPPTIKRFSMVEPNHAYEVDYEAMNQAYCNIVAGACFALGLRYAGTSDENAFSTLLHYCHMFTSLTAKSIAELAGKSTIETCLNVVILSASAVMAGTGNLEIMRLIRHLRRRVGVSNSPIVTYGSHLALHMALGLLFLGGGRYTLSNSPESIAALICAFYPKFPTHSNDNRYHLQAFRHLYVLAVEARLIIPKEVESDEICYANLRIVKLDGTAMNTKVPNIIPDLKTLAKVAVDDERYWPVVFERGKNWDLLQNILSSTGYIEVKQRAGCLSYISDKFGYHSQLARTLTHSEVVPWNPSPNSIIYFTSDKSIKLFCKHLLLDHAGEILCENEQRLKRVLTKITYDAVVKDKLVVIPVYMWLAKFVEKLPTSPDSLAIWQYKIIDSQISMNKFANLISKEMILTLQQEIARVLNTWDDELKQLLCKYLTGKSFCDNITSTVLLKKMATYVVFHDMPYNVGTDSSETLELFIRLHDLGLCTRTVEKIIRAAI
ncbi:unnamed protein product [Acanthoscelides obtectus]|nr:unnamed protein product [Acanthoscelides obtectus]CAK1646669.1 Anaphase-promoting complex subunit 1 [Acanthoscelides obtectus]